MKNQKPLMILRLDFSALTLNLTKIKIPLSRPPIAMNLIFPEIRQVVLVFRLKNHFKTRWNHQDSPRSIDPNFWTAIVETETSQP